jgi:uroporphyrin-III C-methyltransferase / precorrin-2 dehydrogenase / sirohydrochlorin ferrochelatase
MTEEPTEIPNGRIGPLTRLPVFFALAGKRCLVSGGGQAAAWKAELLLATGAHVDVFAPEPSAEMRALAVDSSHGTIAVHERTWQPADLSGAAITVGECADDSEAAQFAAAARAAGVPVNVIDRPDFCDFSFGAIVNRSPLVIGVSTDGAAPVFGQAIRARIETLIPRGFARWADAARKWRPRVTKQTPLFRGRRGFWESFVERAFARPDAVPTEADFTALLAPRTGTEAGSVCLVGVEADDPELLTLRAFRALQSADVILFDRSVSAGILDFARREAKKMLVGTAADAGSGQKQDTDTMVIALAKAGRRVVWLRSEKTANSNLTDDHVAAACRRAGIDLEVVPSVSVRRSDASETADENAPPNFSRTRA